VRYAEVDQQGVVFNSHYLLYCDEALAAYCTQRGARAFADLLRLVTSTLTWDAPAVAGDIVDVDARCVRVGRTSVAMEFTISVGARRCCQVQTVYVHADRAGVPQPVPDDVRAVLD
jgi:acyl-CoA thioester hydrolase